MPEIITDQYIETSIKPFIESSESDVFQVMKQCLFAQSSFDAKTFAFLELCNIYILASFF
ncbi:MAG: hypothetical protein LBM19_01045 [Holosporales bacterium]|nr:hypothetical protein [Holosporales bacterium]